MERTIEVKVREYQTWNVVPRDGETDSQCRKTTNVLYNHVHDLLRSPEVMEYLESPVR